MSIARTLALLCGIDDDRFGGFAFLKTPMDFLQKLEKIARKNNSLVCVGLDPQLEKLPKGYLLKKDPIYEFNRDIINKTAHFVCSYKPNIAFYEAYGLNGLSQLKQTIEYIKSQYPQIPLILDAKRADIANTARMYAKAAFEYWGADAVTVYPHLGLDSLEPFLSYTDKHTFLLVKTSNPDSETFQNLKTKDGFYYIAMAKQIRKWDKKNIGIFAGATYQGEIAKLREIFPNKIFLSAGVGAQGAELEKCVKAGIDKNKKGIIFNASRSIIYSKDPKSAARNLRDEINKYRQSL